MRDWVRVESAVMVDMTACETVLAAEADRLAKAGYMPVVRYQIMTAEDHLAVVTREEALSAIAYRERRAERRRLRSAP